jgi:hypothetical protein
MLTLFKECTIRKQNRMRTVDRSHVVFDEYVSLKCDYDFTCRHIAEALPSRRVSFKKFLQGEIVRSNRILMAVDHYVNAGGCVSAGRLAGDREAAHYLRAKWPGVFRWNSRRDGKKTGQVITQWTRKRRLRPYGNDPCRCHLCHRPTTSRKYRTNKRLQSLGLGRFRWWAGPTCHSCWQKS